MTTKLDAKMELENMGLIVGDQKKANLTVQEKEFVEKVKHEVAASSLQAIDKINDDLNKQSVMLSEQLLDGVKSETATQSAQLLSDLINTLGEVDINGNRKWHAKIPVLNKLVKRVEVDIQRHTPIIDKINSISDTITKNKLALIKDNESLDELRRSNTHYVQSIELMRTALIESLDDIVNEEIPLLVDKAMQSERYDDKQEVIQKQNLALALDKKITTMAISRIAAEQRDVKLNMLIQGNAALINKIETTLTDTINLWKNEIAIIVSSEKQRRVGEVMKNVSDTTNEIIRRSSEALNENMVAIAKESHRNIIDVESLKYAQSKLLNTIQETKRISEQAIQNEKEVRKELEMLSINLNETIKGDLLLANKGKQ